MKEKFEELIYFFFQHVVPIQFQFKVKEDIQNLYVTAFVLSVQDSWFLVTAGHCFEKVNKLLDNGYPLVGASLIDFLGLEARDKNPIPFVYDKKRVHFYYEEGEYDYGFIPLTQYYVELLESNKVRALDERVWKQQPVLPIRHLLIGMPKLSETNELAQYVITPTIIFVDKVNGRPIGFKETDFPFFYGKINLTGGLEDITGMSGGPLLAFQPDDEGRLRYWVIALQSSWLPDSHFIKACPVKLLGEYLEYLLKQSNNDLW